MDCSAPGFHVHHQLPKLAQTHVHQVGDAIQPSHPLLSPSPPVFNLSQNQVFPNESVLRIRWPKYWSFSVSISPSSEYSELISFQIDWFDILAVQGTLKSLLQCHSSEASIFQCSAFFMVQLSHSYMTTGKTLALTIWTFSAKWMEVYLYTKKAVSRFLHDSQWKWQRPWTYQWTGNFTKLCLIETEKGGERERERKKEGRKKQNKIMQLF